MSRSFSSGSRTVRRRWSASGWPGPERARHEAAAQEGLGDGGRPARRTPKSTRRKFVTDGPTDQPAAAQGRRSGGPARVSTRVEVGVEDRRSSRRASVTTVTETVETEPGGRYGLSRAIDLGARDARTRPAGRPARRPCWRSGRRSGSGRPIAKRDRSVAPDELGVGLVEDDDRGRASGRRRHRRRVRRRSAAIAPSGSASAVGLFGLHSQTTWASRAAARDGGRRRAPSPASAPSRGHRDDRRAALLGERRGTSRRSGPG